MISDSWRLRSLVETGRQFRVGKDFPNLNLENTITNMFQDTKKSFFANMNELLALACVKVSHYSSICNDYSEIAVKNCSDHFSDNA